MDENTPLAVAQQLRLKGVEITSVRELEIFGVGDPNLLQLARDNDWIVCTRDADFLRLARANIEHAGIVFFDRGQRNIGYIVRSLMEIAEDFTMDDMRNLVTFR